MQRRDFLAAGLTAAVYNSTGVSLPAAPTRDGMTFGFSTYGAKALKTEAAINLLADIGFDSVELTIWPQWDANPAAMSSRRRRALRKLLVARKIRVTSLMEHLHIDETNRSPRARLERVKLAAELAHDLSPGTPPLMQTTIGGGGKWKDVRDRYAAEVGRWLKVADADDLVIAIKPHRGGAFSRPVEAAELIKRLDRPKRLRMCYDFSHYDFRDMTLEGTIRTALPHVAHVAIKDVVQKDGRTRFVLPGEGGRIDYSRLLRLFHDGGYRGDICCEISGQVWSQPGYTPLKSARTCYTNIATAFEKARVPRTRKPDGR
ncbi:MAG: sugar phosphate isomerase/epimerase family protein [Planctomycetaceae bacterium]